MYRASDLGFVSPKLTWIQNKKRGPLQTTVTEFGYHVNSGEANPLLSEEAGPVTPNLRSSSAGPM